MKEMTLTKRQVQILELLQDFRGRHGYSPTVREIAGELGLSSVATVAEHLDSLEAKGLVRRKRDRSRSLLLSAKGQSALERRSTPGRAGIPVPLLGVIAAGEPIEAISNPEEIEVPSALAGGSGCYALRVNGDSMIGEGIFDGDYVVVEEKPVPDNGDTVVALLDGANVTLKKFYKERKGGKKRIRLQPANPEMEPIILGEDDTIEIQGRVRGLVRILQGS